jgi:hypothetical protein
MSEDAEGQEKQPRKKKKFLGRLLRLAVLAGIGVFIAKKVKSRSAPPEGLWREGISGDGQASGDRH